jgi:hypothetical protein
MIKTAVVELELYNTLKVNNTARVYWVHNFHAVRFISLTAYFDLDGIPLPLWYLHTLFNLDRFKDCDLIGYINSQRDLSKCAKTII